MLALGISLGLFFAGSLIAGPIASRGTIFATIIICNNVLASLFSRLGRLIDGILRVSTPQKEDYKTEFNVNSGCCLALIRSVSLASLLHSIGYSANKNRDLNDNEIKFKLKRAQSSPAFFHFYNAGKSFNADNKLGSVVN